MTMSLQDKSEQPRPTAPDINKGLATADIPALQARYGPNSLETIRKKPLWRIAASQFKSLLTLLLAVAAVLSFLFDDIPEGLAITIVIIINAAIGFWAEHKADRSMAALRRMGRTSTRVRRDGQLQIVPAETLVPGDIVILEAGDIVPADLLLAESTRLQSDESLLTGESVPVDKAASDTTIASNGYAANKLFKGASVTRGICVGIVEAIGKHTALGEIAELTNQAEASASPLEKRLQKLSEQLLIAVLLVMVFLTAAGILSGRDGILMIKTGIALAVAAIPQGLPVVATLTLARSMWRLASKNALIERLSAVETLGSVSTIISDKTGTLTENRMKVVALETPDDESGTPAHTARCQDRAYRVCALCFSGTSAEHIADPMEHALVDAAASAGHPTASLSATYPRLEEEAFDPELRMMATRHQIEDHELLLVKGAPEAVLSACNKQATTTQDRALTPDDQKSWLQRAELMAAKGYRVLALADKHGERICPPFYQDLVFVGLVGFEDPPRADAAAAVAAARAAGIRVIMATGDNAHTATNIAKAVGIESVEDTVALVGGDVVNLDTHTGSSRERLLRTTVFARMTPRHKLDLIDFYQRNGEIVAMTGDGVNDAPALKKADVGVAMGLRGTEVAKEAAAMILKDDAFASIVMAIHQGRVIFSNIRKLVIYLLSCNLCEVLVITSAILLGLPLPLLPLQILFVNLVTDVFPALALGLGRGDEEIVHRPPRPKSEGILQTRHWQAIIGYALVMTIVVLAGFLWALTQPGKPDTYASTVAFMVLALGQLWHVFNMRSRKAPILGNQVMQNPYVWGAILLCLGLVAAANIWTPLVEVLRVSPLRMTDWAVIFALSLLPLILGQTAKAFSHWKRSNQPAAGVNWI